PGRQDGAGAAGVGEGNALEKLDVILDAQSAIEMDQVGAAAQQDMLAVVEQPAGGGVLKAGRPPPQQLAALDQRDIKTGVHEGSAGGNTGQAGTDDGDTRRIVDGQLLHAAGL